ncbi:MAG: MarC family protein [Helicobacter sp.]|uniref:MarC family protein n=1 Tax=Helicobacter sp. TaxID=218 RepID=UPI0023D5B399|nr:MarC family protein [Helicobacter sp.]MDE5925269.1 MarC family protein [Helicobacter sp.]MDE7175784.1 MarC family protein [Helicobacter sp.]
MFAGIESQLYSLLLIAITIIAVLNPFGNLPQFISMTDDLETTMRQSLFRNILYVAFVIVILFLLTGPFIMTFLFKIDLNHLRIAGGFLLILVSTKGLLLPSHKEMQQHEGLSKSELLNQSIVPMAFPMLVGPGTLSTVVVLSEEKGLMLTIFAVIAAFAFMLGLFHFAASIERILGKLALHVLSRIALVFIMAMGVKMILIGLKAVF